MSHEISTNDAAAMTSRHRANRDSILDANFQKQDILPICHTFVKSAFATMMQDDDCTSIRVYFGMDENNKIHPIIVGVNNSNEDMLPSSSTTATDRILDDGDRCPNNCPPSSALNSD